MTADEPQLTKMFERLPWLRAASPRRLAAWSLPVLGVLALAAALLWLLPVDPALAQDDAKGPKITAAPAIASSPQSGGVYRAGETIIVTLTFSQPVEVAGKPRLRLKIGNQNRWAGYDSAGKDGMTLSFVRTVKPDDADADGVGIGKNQLRLNGGTIKDADGNAANLKHPALPTQEGHKVNGSPDEPEPEPTPTPEPPANNAPQFADGSAARSVAELSLPGAEVGAPVAATDDDGDGLTYALTGGDAGAFNLDAASGQMRVKDALDYEAKAGYSVTVTVHDGKNAAGEADDSVDDTIAVTVTVLNVDEPGAVVLDTDEPQVGTEVTATLSDPDGGVTGLTWAWERSPNGGEWTGSQTTTPADTTGSIDSPPADGWTAIEGATGAAYTPVDADAGQYLRAVGSYDDGEGSGKSAQAAAPSAVARPSATDYDSDDDGLISVATQAQLAAITLDPDGDGVSNDGSRADEYRAAFPDAAAGMGCPDDTGCAGYELDGNLTLTGMSRPIGADEYGDVSSFTGTFDGNGNTVSGLRIPTGPMGGFPPAGLFARLGEGGVIRNVGVIAPSIDNWGVGGYAGGLVGDNRGAISGSYVSDGAIASRGGKNATGGLVGDNRGAISNSHASGKVSTVSAIGDQDWDNWAKVGGLVGHNSGAIRDSYASATVSSEKGHHNEVGGLVGSNKLGGTVSNSHASGGVTGDGAVGGLVGRNSGAIRDSHAKAATIRAHGGKDQVGGLVGQNDGGTISNSHAEGGVFTDGGAAGGLVGRNDGGAISNSYADGGVVATSAGCVIGGLVGWTDGGTISNSYATTIHAILVKSGAYTIGGLVGQNDGGAISNSYAAGRTEFNWKRKRVDPVIGGLVGQNDDGTVSNSYWDKKASGVTTSDGSPDSAGKTTKKMKKATGPGRNIYTGWDTGIWDFSDTASYPTLR